MLQWFCFGIISMVIVALSLILWKLQKQTLSNQIQSLTILATVTNRQIQMNQTLTNLLLSKEPMTFQGLQAVTNQQQSQLVDEVLNPLDDASVAERLAEQYKRHGLDPNSAYNQEEPVDFASEFGI